VNKTNHIVTDQAARQQFGHYAGILSFKMGQTDLRYNREVVQSIMRSILFDYLELMMAAVPQSNDAGEPAVGQRQVLFNRFLELLSTRHVKHQLVDTYAQELCVSPNYLTKVCRELTGKTALQWVREYTEADVRYYLLNSDMSVKEICDHLGFPNLSFFGKYCRRAFGLSPTEFRKQKENK
jgi:AraC family transcriptional activator of pobA